jgi:hypothetical protein
MDGLGIGMSALGCPLKVACSDFAVWRFTLRLKFHRHFFKFRGVVLGHILNQFRPSRTIGGKWERGPE